MAIQVITFVTVLAAVVWLVYYMRAQKPESSVLRWIQEGDYQKAVEEADRQLANDPADSATHLHRAEALKLLGRFSDSASSYREALRLKGVEAAASEGLALALTYLGVDLDQARKLMEGTIQAYPEIQEFQALSLAYILLRLDRRDEALRLFEDHRELLTTRFEMDYTDADDLLAETVYLFATLSGEAGDRAEAARLFGKVKLWAPKSVFARGVEGIL